MTGTLDPTDNHGLRRQWVSPEESAVARELRYEWHLDGVTGQFGGWRCREADWPAVSFSVASYDLRKAHGYAGGCPPAGGRAWIRSTLNWRSASVRVRRTRWRPVRRAVRPWQACIFRSPATSLSIRWASSRTRCWPP